MDDKSRAKVARSVTTYRGLELVEDNTEAVTISDPQHNVVVEITPYPGTGLAQIVTMTDEQSRRITGYLRKQSRVLRELNRTELLLDITYIPEKKWRDDTLAKVHKGSALFPVMDLRTVPIGRVKQHLS